MNQKDKNLGIIKKSSYSNDTNQTTIFKDKIDKGNFDFIWDEKYDYEKEIFEGYNDWIERKGNKNN